jgi:hypothetical protein
VQGGPVHMGRPGAVGLQSLRNHPQEDTQHHVEHCLVTLHEVAQSLRDRQHPLAHRQAGKNMIAEVRRRLHHAPRVARGAHAPTFAGEGDEVVVAAVITARAGKAVRKNAAFQVFAESLADIGLGGVVVALPVELTCAGEFMLGLEMFGNGLVEQRALGVAWVVELGLCTGLSTRMRMRLRWAYSGGHGAVPAWAGCVMIRGLYRASPRTVPTIGCARYS